MPPNDTPDLDGAILLWLTGGTMLDALDLAAMPHTEEARDTLITAAFQMFPDETRTRRWPNQLPEACVEWVAPARVNHPAFDWSR